MEVSQDPAETAEQAEPAFADFRTPRKCRSPRRDMAVIIDFSPLVGWSERILVQINSQEMRRLAGMMTAEPSRDRRLPGRMPSSDFSARPGPTQIVREETKRWLSSYEPGASVSLVARRHDINANLLFTWRRQMGASALAASPLEMILMEVTSGAPVAVPTAAAEMERAV
ncbi:transposase [Mesorhizobium sp. M1027]|uniref:transposase n=1 Tax=Mesorhizobium sp. M1027 TaxID=2957050 RepID=UPI00333CB820